MDEDTSDAARAQQALNEQEQWARHERVYKEFQEWAIREGLISTHTREHHESKSND